LTIAQQQLADALGKMCLGPEQLRELRSYLAARVRAAGCEQGDGVFVQGCDKTLRHTRHWAEEQRLDIERVLESVGAFGGYCDCEVLFNVTPDKFGW
jgi:hypothetical protein